MNDMNRISVLGVAFDNLNMREAVERAQDAIHRRSGGWVVTPNPEIVMLCRENNQLATAVQDAEMVIADGIGVIYGARILRTPLKEKLPGIDFASALMSELAKENGSVYLFGAKPGVAEMAAENLSAQFPGLRICGTHDGYFTDDAPIVADINEKKPDLLLICLGAPKQELWMQKHAGEIDAGLMIGLGGSLDVFAGVVQRAPEFWQKSGLEWLYRLLKEPKRIGRMLKLPQFLLTVIGQKLRKKR